MTEEQKKSVESLYGLKHALESTRKNIQKNLRTRQ